MAIKKFRVKSGKIHTETNGKAVVYKQGDVFSFEEDNLRNLASQVELIPDIQPVAPVEVKPPAPTFEIRKREGLSGNQPSFDVIDTTTGQPVNDEPLFRATADKLLEEKLNG